MAATDTGNVTVYSRSHLNERIIQNVSAHFGPIMNIAVSPDCRNLFTAGKDGTIFVFSIGDQFWNFKEKCVKASLSHIEETDKKGVKDIRAKIVDPDLADIVLVKRNEMIEWQKR